MPDGKEEPRSCRGRREWQLVALAQLVACTSRTNKTSDWPNWRTNGDTKAVVSKCPHEVQLDPVERDASKVEGDGDVSEIITDEHN